MSTIRIHPDHGSPNKHSPGRGATRHRKRSSSLFALAELILPSPPLSPSVSINVSNETNTTGEIPIIFDFLTTGSMPSEERISKMGGLKPNLPPLAKFSPMSAFFPMSDSSGSLNTINTDAFGSHKPELYYSDAEHRRNSMLSDLSSAYSPLDADFDLPSPTEPVNNYKDPSDTQVSIVSSTSTPSVHVLDYDTGHKELGDISDFTISAYLSCPSVCGNDTAGPLQHSKTCVVADHLEKDLEAQIEYTDVAPSSEHESYFSPGSPNNGLLSVSTTPDLDDKTPTQATFSNRQTQSNTISQPHLSSSGAGAEVKLADLVTPSLITKDLNPNDASPACGGSLTAPPTPDFDDKTPTQATFLRRQTNVEAQSQYASCQSAHAEVASVPSLHTSSGSDIEAPNSRPAEKDLPPKPVDDDLAGDKLLSNDITMSPCSIQSQRSVFPVPCLKHAQWLRDTIVELWIDQEGFRAIRPKFFLASISNGLPYSQNHYDPNSTPFGMSELTEEHDALYTTVAEFLPVSRAAHYFHHAPLDRAPTLHRITTGGDETRDYITRAATLALRDNGVFFVHGTEDHRVDADSPLSIGALGNGVGNHSNSNTFHHNGHASGGRIVRLNWRFEYFVSSRRPDGRSAHRGEKIMTPLSFSCTPALLDRSRASKVKVLHLMKKTLLPNLVAQKLEPPDLPMLLRTHASSSSLASSFTSASFPMSESQSSLASHQSVRNEFGLGSGTVASISPSFVSPRFKPLPRPPLPYTKHRRGSHSDTTPEDFMRQQNGSLSRAAAHERSRSACTFDRGNSARPSERDPRNSANVPPLVGPIISQEELFRMLDSQQGPELDRRPHSIRVEVIDNVHITSLPAAPRYR